MLNNILYLRNQNKPDILNIENKNISTQSAQLLSYFNEQNKACFDISLAQKALPNSKDGAIRELLSDMTRRGLLMRLKEGIYHIIPYEANTETFMPDWHLIAEHIVNDAQHYIGYYSALQIHNHDESNERRNQQHQRENYKQSFQEQSLFVQRRLAAERQINNQGLGIMFRYEAPEGITANAPWRMRLT